MFLFGTKMLPLFQVWRTILPPKAAVAGAPTWDNPAWHWWPWRRHDLSIHPSLGTKMYKDVLKVYICNFAHKLHILLTFYSNNFIHFWDLTWKKKYGSAAGQLWWAKLQSKLSNISQLHFLLTVANQEAPRWEGVPKATPTAEPKTSRGTENGWCLSV